MKELAIATFSILVGAQAMAQTNSKAAQMVSQMTLEEKAQLVVGLGMKVPGMNITVGGPVVGQTQDKVPGAAGTTYSIQRLGLSGTVMADGPAGVRIAPFRNGDSSVSYYCTAFPIATLLASSWDTALVNAVGKAMGNEVREYGIDVLLAPALNIHRNPLGGRNFEYYSEDPIVSGFMATAMVKGIESNGVGTSVKHFAANNNETNRFQTNVIVSERALREIYLRGFEMVVKQAQPWTLMSSYNKINGVYTSESYDLLQTILRKEWGYKGMVVTDWLGGKDAVAQMKAGNDLLMPGRPDQVKAILDGIKSGALSEKVLDENAIRVVELSLRSPSQRALPFSNKPDLKAHAQIARQAAADGMVLLQNNNAALPLSAGTKKIAAFGNTSYDFIAGGTGSGDVNEAYTVSLAEGLTKAGLTLDAKVHKAYHDHMSSERAKQPKKQFFWQLLPPLPELAPADALLQQAVAESDIAFITIGRNAGEFQDRKEQDDFNLTAAEQQLISRVSAAFKAKNKKVVVILNIGGVIETASWKNKVDAILLSWQGGQEGGHAVADVLMAKVNPSGKLISTFPMRYSDDPSAKNFPGIELPETEKPANPMMAMMMGKPAQVTYEEGVYVGYRYYETFKVPVSFSFGFGLSYSSFNISNLKLAKANADGTVQATVVVKNTGKVAGKEVVQLYLSAPASDMHKPSKELKGFAKTRLLKPGESQTISFSLQAKDLASFDEASTSWVAEPGKYTLQAGNAINNLPVQAGFELPAKIVVEQCNKALVPTVSINELKSSR